MDRGGLCAQIRAKSAATPAFPVSRRGPRNVKHKKGAGTIPPPFLVLLDRVPNQQLIKRVNFFRDGTYLTPDGSLRGNDVVARRHVRDGLRGGEPVRHGCWNVHDVAGPDGLIGTADDLA